MNTLRLLLTSTALLALVSLTSHAEIIGVDFFDYPDGPIAGKNGGTFWDYKNFSPIGHTGVKSTWEDIFFGGSATVSNGTLVTNNNGWARRNYNGQDQAQGAVNDPASSPSSVAKTVFYRVTVTTGATLPNYFGFASYDFNTEQMFLGKRIGSNNFGYQIVGGASANGSTAVPINSTFTLVMRLDFVANGISLFFNPNLRLPFNSGANLAEGTLVATQSYTATNWSTALRLASGSGGDPIVWDNLVVATTWEDLADPMVTTLVDEDNGFLGGGQGISLREAVKYGVTGPITFATGLSGQTITLTHPDGDMEIPQAVTIDATALPGGITLNGNNTGRHFYVGTNKSLTLRGITFTGGNLPGQAGGAVYNDRGALTISDCTFTGNNANEGGAICNVATPGSNSQFTEIRRCTFTGNTGFRSGAILNALGKTTVLSSTLSGNSSFNTSAIATAANATTFVGTSIVSGNSGGDVGGDSPTSTSSLGGNLIGTGNAAGSFTGPLDQTSITDPKLSPLGFFGGPVQTMHPLIGSPAIDAAGIINPGGTDARGFLRFVDGNNAGGAQLDIGAVEAGGVRTVTTAVDEDNGTGGVGLSLREALAASTAPGSRIRFSPSLFSGTILLGSQLTIPATANGLFIDASGLSAPATISGNNASRVFNIPATATVAMHSVRIVNGKAPFVEDGGGILSAISGGGISNFGTLSITSSTLSGNSAAYGGGGIYNEGTLAITSSTLGGNSATSGGGGIYNDGTLAITSSTLSGNSADTGGGIYNDGTLAITHSTLSGNSATSGGGIYNNRTLALNHSIVTSNTPANLNGSAPTGSQNLTTGDALLAPLGDYGGPTQTMALRPGSPARDAATDSTRTTDQRGFLMVNTPDLGAYEAGTAGNLATTLAETLPNTGPASSVTPEGDFDGDGASNQHETTAGTILTNPGSILRITQLVRSGANLVITFPSVSGKSYTLWQNDTLGGTWTNTNQPAISGNGSLLTFSIPAPVNGVPRRFYRVQVSP